MTSTQQINNKINHSWAIIGIISSHGFEPFFSAYLLLFFLSFQPLISINTNIWFSG